MPKISLKPTHKAVVEFYSALENFQKLAVKHELAIKTPFQNLLDSAAKQLNWTLVPFLKKTYQLNRLFSAS